MLKEDSYNRKIKHVQPEHRFSLYLYIHFYFSGSSEQPETSVVIYYESVMMYTHVLNETLSAGGDPKDGIAMTKKMWNRTFQG